MLWENGINGILADEMGLGKTVQCIATIALMIQRGVPGPFLVCGPLSTLPNWMAEFQRFTPEVRHISFSFSISFQMFIYSVLLSEFNCRSFCNCIDLCKHYKSYLTCLSI